MLGAHQVPLPPCRPPTFTPCTQRTCSSAMILQQMPGVSCVISAPSAAWLCCSSDWAARPKQARSQPSTSFTCGTGAAGYSAHIRGDNQPSHSSWMMPSALATQPLLFSCALGLADVRHTARVHSATACAAVWLPPSGLAGLTSLGIRLLHLHPQLLEVCYKLVHPALVGLGPVWCVCNGLRLRQHKAGSLGGQLAHCWLNTNHLQTASTAPGRHMHALHYVPVCDVYVGMLRRGECSPGNVPDAHVQPCSP